MSQKLLHLVVFGKQGAGKGTQAKALSRHYGLVYLGLGELFRELAEENTPIAQRVKRTIDAGHLIPDPITNQLVAQKLGNIPPSEGFVLDGYPRNVLQAQALHRTLHGLNRLVPKPAFLNLEIDQEELLGRLAKRRQTEQRVDDSDAGIAKRLEIYHNETHPVLESVAEWAEVFGIDGNRTVAEVTAAIHAALDKADTSDG